MTEDANRPSGPLRAPERQGVRGALEERAHAKWMRRQIKRSVIFVAALPPAAWAFWQALVRFWDTLAGR